MMRWASQKSDASPSPLATVFFLFMRSLQLILRRLCTRFMLDVKRRHTRRAACAYRRNQTRENIRAQAQAQAQAHKCKQKQRHKQRQRCRHKHLLNAACDVELHCAVHSCPNRILRCDSVPTRYTRLKEQAMAAREVEWGEESSDWRVLRTQELADQRNAAVVESMRQLSSALQRGRLEGGVRVSDEALEAWSQLRSGFWELVAEEEVGRGCIKRAIECVDRHCAELGAVREELGDEVSALRRKLVEAQAREREGERMWSLRAAGTMSELQSRCEAAEEAEAAARAQVERLEGKIQEMQANDLAADEERFKGMAAKLRWAEESQRKHANALVQHSQLASLQVGHPSTRSELE